MPIINVNRVGGLAPAATDVHAVAGRRVSQVRSAASAVQRATEMALRAVGDPLAEIGGISDDDPDAPAAHVLQAALGVLAKDARVHRLIRAALDATTVTSHSLTAWEIAHLDAARRWLEGEPRAAARQYERILERWPRDLLALRLAQSCYFFLGEHRKMSEVVDLVAPAWSSSDPAFAYVQAMSAFARAETGDAETAEALGRRALSVEPACPYGVHAVAHALLERGEHARGAAWMKQQEAHWKNGSRMLAHNAWHLALFELESGNVDAAVELLDEWLLPHAADSPLDAADATGLLWRLETRGWRARDRWRFLSDCWNATHGCAGHWPYLDLHAAVAFHGAGHHARLQHLTGQITTCAQGSNAIAMRAREIALPGLSVVAAFMQGEPFAAEHRERLRARVCEIGGSRAQLDIFEQMLQSPEERTGRHRSMCRA